MNEWILKAQIDANGCIGCIKCLRFCPTDAIVGAKRSLHIVLAERCTACGKCIEICPTDCIALLTLAPPVPSDIEQQLMEQKSRRIADKNSFEPQTILTQPQLPAEAVESRLSRKEQVAAAIARVKAKRQQRTRFS